MPKTCGLRFNPSFITSQSLGELSLFFPNILTQGQSQDCLQGVAGIGDPVRAPDGLCQGQSAGTARGFFMPSADLTQHYWVLRTSIMGTGSRDYVFKSWGWKPILFLVK